MIGKATLALCCEIQDQSYPIGQTQFRIKVWEISSGGIVYDNGSGLNDADPPTEPGAGNIVIHAGKKLLYLHLAFEYSITISR